MKKQGFVITKDGTSSQFFTSRSSYDHPKWIPITEATVYPTAELANTALLKLIRYGAYSAQLKEASSMEFEFPDEGPNKNQSPITQTSDGEMKAGQLSDDSIEGLNIEDDDIEMGDEYDDPEEQDDFDDEEFPDDEGFEHEEPIEGEDESDHEFDDEIDDYSEEEFPSDQSRIRENFQMPSKPKSDAKPSENKNTILDVKSAEVIKFKDNSSNPEDFNYSQDIEPLDHKVSIPANVMSAIKDSIDTYNKAAEFNKGKDDAQASMALTIVDALENIESCLKLGTHEGLRQAQIKITSFMNPITTNFPSEVIDYLYKSGRQPITLKDVFYNKWDNRKKE